MKEYYPVSLNLECVHNANRHVYDEFPELVESRLLIRVEKGKAIARKRTTGEIIELDRINPKKIYLVSKITARVIGDKLPVVFAMRGNYCLYSYYPKLVECIQVPYKPHFGGIWRRTYEALPVKPNIWK